MDEMMGLHTVQLTEYLHRKASRAHIPLSGTFELSPACNFACRMCYVRKSEQEIRQSPRPIMTLEDWRRIAVRARERGMLYLLLTGGEPLLWPDFWTLYDELIDMGFLVSINTNGSLIDDRAVAHFVKRPPRRINLTLYGACDETYERLCGAKHVFARVDRAIMGLKEAGILLKLNCSLTPYNVCDLEAMVAYAREREIYMSAVSYMFPPVRRDCALAGQNEARFTAEEAADYQLEIFRLQHTPAQYRAYLENILRGYVEPPELDEGCVDPLDGKIRCRAGKASFWITWDGWMTPCGMMPEPRADVRQLDFGKAWEQTVEASEALRLSGLCSTCPNASICHTCAAMAYAETGTAGGVPRYLCRMTTELDRKAREILGT